MVHCGLHDFEKNVVNDPIGFEPYQLEAQRIAYRPGPNVMN